MNGINSINAKNQDQLDILKEIEDELTKQSSNPTEYGGKSIMLDGPGGHGKTFLLETIYAYCNLPENNYLALCSAFSGKIDNVIVEIIFELRSGSTTITKWNDNSQTI